MPNLTRFLRPALLLLTLVLPASGHAATTDLAGIPSGPYTLDPAHASIVFRVSHLGFSHYTGRFNSIDAKLDFDSVTPENSKLDVTIIPNSVDTGNPKLEEELRGAPYFNVIKFREMRFVATKIERTGPATGRVTGDFTMLGATHSVTLDVTFNGGGEHPFKKTPMLGFSAKGTLKRSEFGLQNLIPMVGDDVAFEIEAEFNKAP